MTSQHRDVTRTTMTSTRLVDVERADDVVKERPQVVEEVDGLQRCRRVRQVGEGDHVREVDGDDGEQLRLDDSPRLEAVCHPAGQREAAWGTHHVRGGGGGGGGGGGRGR